MLRFYVLNLLNQLENLLLTWQREADMLESINGNQVPGFFNRGRGLSPKDTAYGKIHRFNGWYYG